MSRLRVAFAGTPAFAAAALQGVIEAGHEVPLVLTQPDRPAGRGMKLQASPVKTVALGHGLPVAQPAGLGLDGRHAADAADAGQRLRAARPQVLVVAAYGLILPRWVLDLPLAFGDAGCLNIHASLLPRWRGAAPIHRALEAGDTSTGITIMRMDEGLDTGDMLLSEALAIAGDDTTATLHDRLAALGARLIVQALEADGGAALPRRPQPSEGVTYARKIDKSEAPLDWSAPAVLLERRIRAFDPFPGATATFGVESVKVWHAEVTEGAGEPGRVIAHDEAGPVVACGHGALRLTVLQRPGARRLPARQALQGLPEWTGSRLVAD